MRFARPFDQDALSRANNTSASTTGSAARRACSAASA
jgi:hypothetical protein